VVDWQDDSSQLPPPFSVVAGRPAQEKTCVFLRHRQMKKNRVFTKKNAGNSSSVSTAHPPIPVVSTAERGEAIECLLLPSLTTCRTPPTSTPSRVEWTFFCTVARLFVRSVLASGCRCAVLAFPRSCSSFERDCVCLLIA
jgi:hypothetical protein